MSLFTRWMDKEPPAAVRIAALTVAGILFVIMLPYIVCVRGLRADRRLGLPNMRLGALNPIIGGFLAITGMSFAQWSIFDQVTRGRGTPLPILPTQELLTQGPFRYCRNPMALGTILTYLGLAIAFGTISGVVLVLVLTALLLLYIKHIEERELAERFGPPYLRYKDLVPFIIPKVPKQK